MWSRWDSPQIALESGLTESWAVESFVAGGPDELPLVLRNGFTHGFGELGENQELVQWGRNYNADPSHRRKIRFYGMDMAGGRDGKFQDARRSIDFPLAFLSRADSAGVDKIRAAIDPILDRFAQEKYNSLSQAERGRIESGLSEIAAAMVRKRSELVAGSSADEYDWALRSLDVARQLSRYFRVAPAYKGPGRPPEAGAAMMARDSAMAENVRWALEREGPNGRVILFAHDGHVMNSKIEGGRWAAIREKPSPMGMLLRSALGEDLVIMGTSAGGAAPGLPRPEPVANSIDAALGRIRIPPIHSRPSAGAGQRGGVRVAFHAKAYAGEHRHTLCNHPVNCVRCSSLYRPADARPPADAVALRGS